MTIKLINEALGSQMDDGIRYCGQEVNNLALLGKISVIHDMSRDTTLFTCAALSCGLGAADPARPVHTSAKYPCPFSSPPSSYVLDDGTGSAEVKQFLDGDTARVRGLLHESRLSLSPHALTLRRRWARHGPPWPAMAALPLLPL